MAALSSSPAPVATARATAVLLAGGCSGLPSQDALVCRFFEAASIALTLAMRSCVGRHEGDLSLLLTRFVRGHGEDRRQSFQQPSHALE